MWKKISDKYLLITDWIYLINEIKIAEYSACKY